MELQRLKEQLEAIQADRKRVADSGLDTSIVDGTIRDLQQQIAEVEQNQQAHEVKVQEVTESIIYEVDTMDFGGLSLMEIVTNDGEYELVREGFQNKLIQQAQGFLNQLHDLQIQSQQEIKQHVDRSLEREAYIVQCEQTINTLSPENFQLKLENEDVKAKRDNAILQIEEASAQIEQQKQHISDLQTQIAIGVRGALNVVHMPQDTSKIAEEIKARKVRITDVKFKDESGIDRRIKTAVEVLTGKEIEYEAIYERRYIILNLEEAAQYRAEIEQKKAEEEAQNAVIPTLESPSIEPVSEQEAPAAEIPFQAETEVHSSEFGLVDGSLPVLGERDAAEEPNEVDYTPVTKAEFEARVTNVEKGMDMLMRKVFGEVAA